jgi:rubrerythrin
LAQGYKTTLEFLLDDIGLEEEAMRLYSEYASKSPDEKVRATFEKLIAAERAHADAPRRVVREIEEDRHAVIMYCPFCGWEMNYGEMPAIGNEQVCPVCCRKYALVEESGDYRLKQAP